MESIGEKLSECRTAKGLLQSELGRIFYKYHFIVGSYEREEVKPIIDVEKKLVEFSNGCFFVKI